MLFFLMDGKTGVPAVIHIIMVYGVGAGTRIQIQATLNKITFTECCMSSMLSSKLGHKVRISQFDDNCGLNHIARRETQSTEH